MTQKHFETLVCLLILCLLGIWWWRQSRARKRFAQTIKMMNKEGVNEIAGQPVEYWLDLLNQDFPQPITAIDTMVLTYKGHDFFFIDGRIPYIATTSGAYWSQQKAFLLIAVEESAARLLSRESALFRRIDTSTEVAAFSIYRWSDFSDRLKTPKS